MMFQQTTARSRALLPAIALLSAGATSAAAPAAAADALVGTWRLVAFEDVEDGKILRPFGEKPLGLFIYTADGHISIQIANPANPSCFAPGKLAGRGKADDRAGSACTPAQMQALLDGTVAYWGTYKVDMAAGIVTHNVLSDVSNGYTGTAQPRPFKLDGDRLEIGDGKTWRRVLQRVRP